MHIPSGMNPPITDAQPELESQVPECNEALARNNVEAALRGESVMPSGHLSLVVNRSEIPVNPVADIRMATAARIAIRNIHEQSDKEAA